MSACLERSAVFHVIGVGLFPLDISVSTLESLFWDTFEFLLDFIDHNLF